MRLAAALLGASVAACGCGAPLIPASTQDPLAGVPPAPSRSSPAPAGVGTGGARDDSSAAIAEMLASVSQARELSVLRPVVGRRVTRAQGIALIRERTEKDIPRAVLEAQGELLRALELVPSDYDLAEGMYAILEGNVAGFYDPDEDRMYLVDDLDAAGERETLAHELVHALQDQHYDLGDRLEYRPGDLDRLAATSSLAEGDAMTAMFEAAYGDAELLDGAQLRFMMTASVALSESGATTPRALQASLVAPYIDGFRFVAALRERGGWTEVARAWREPPATTEQILHLDKYDLHEPPRPIAELPLPEGDGWRVVDADALGEQGLRIALEQWTSVSAAGEGAAGWGGDRYLVASRGDGATAERAVGWIVRFDSTADAEQAAEIVRGAFPAACVERPRLGPLGWRRQADRIGLVAGPHTVTPNGRPAAGSNASCADARPWLERVLAAR